ncbi:rCG52945 [Rattus norvegicus]|uniref:RCG52945 n=1 Tax=Rattus norvegicus TaxID=10116 RepID=A6IQX3_RAT|nr:rCG52945 [Rattus norvegicus]
MPATQDNLGERPQCTCLYTGDLARGATEPHNTIDSFASNIQTRSRITYPEGQLSKIENKQTIKQMSKIKPEMANESKEKNMGARTRV